MLSNYVKKITKDYVLIYNIIDLNLNHKSVEILMEDKVLSFLAQVAKVNEIYEASVNDINNNSDISSNNKDNIPSIRGGNKTVKMILLTQCLAG